VTEPISIAATADEAARALWAGDAKTAAALYLSLTEREPSVAGHWVNLGLARRRMGDREAELEALNAALALEPRLLVALLLKGANFEDRGDLIACGQAFKIALAAAPPFERVPPDLRPMIRRAQAGVARHQAAYETIVRDRLAEAYREVSGARLDRFDQAVDIVLGKKAVYRQVPHNFYFPGLPESQFYDRDQFAWLGAIEAETDAIREEFESVWRADHGFTPYIEYPPGAPVDQWAELNHSPRWSAFHLIRNGAEVVENAPRCPRTMALLGETPAPTLINRSPNAMFSLLKPGTRIPPHTGDTNVRLVVHIPLIIPEKTGFRVGNDTRPWRLGEALIFNDTIEHEAWNDSDQLRVVLIFDIWHPALSPAEQALVGRFMAATTEFLGDSPGGL
jgi:aspartate beta-hydroxylase